VVGIKDETEGPVKRVFRTFEIGRL
jgi:hypothetical protein